MTSSSLPTCTRCGTTIPVGAANQGCPYCSEDAGTATRFAEPAATVSPNRSGPVETPPKRYHDYDALRAFAMLLGIVLHGLMSFIEVPREVWPAQDVQQNTTVYGFVIHALHGFRLPLFFMMSGFFTAMLWRKRGLRKLIVHRVKRIFLPLVVGWFAVWPALIVVGMIGANRQINVWDAAANGRADEVQRYLESGGPIEARFVLPGIPGSGATPLHLAAAGGHEAVTKLLLAHGANVNSIAKDSNRGTPLHWAVGAGKLRSVKILVEAGADIHAEDANGHTPHDWARHVKPADEMPADEMPADEMPADEMSRTIAAYLQSKGATKRDTEAKPTPAAASPTLGLVVLLVFFAPFFAHLWFLWHLCWLVVGFVMVVWLARRFQWNGLPPRALSPPTCWFWLIPLTLLAQLCMVQGFGPDTSAGLIPWPPVLAYYAIFFGFGAILYGHPEAERNVGRHWKICLSLGLATLPVGVWFFAAHQGDRMIAMVDIESGSLAFPHPDLHLPAHFVTSLCAVVYCWSMIFALMGLFRRYCSRENSRIRYVSDSAYWLYLAHLPLIQLIQILVQDWALPGIVKIIMICLTTVAVLLVIYEYGVRYTFIGTMLNGKRYRGHPPTPHPA